MFYMMYCIRNQYVDSVCEVKPPGMCFKKGRKSRKCAYYSLKLLMQITHNAKDKCILVFFKLIFGIVSAKRDLTHTL